MKHNDIHGRCEKLRSALSFTSKHLAGPFLDRYGWFCETVGASHILESVLVCSIFAESTSVTFALEEDCVFTVGRHYSVNSPFALVATFEICENWQSACVVKESSVFTEARPPMLGSAIFVGCNLQNLSGLQVGSLTLSNLLILLTYVKQLP